MVGADAFDTEAEAIARANSTSFGLAGAVWTSDVSRAHHVARSVKAGTFWINSYKTIHVAVPFGGFGDSGHGGPPARRAGRVHADQGDLGAHPGSGLPLPFPFLLALSDKQGRDPWNLQTHPDPPMR